MAQYFSLYRNDWRQQKYEALRALKKHCKQVLKHCYQALGPPDDNNDDVKHRELSLKQFKNNNLAFTDYELHKVSYNSISPSSSSSRSSSSSSRSSRRKKSNKRKPKHKASASEDQLKEISAPGAPGTPPQTDRTMRPSETHASANTTAGTLTTASAASSDSLLSREEILLLQNWDDLSLMPEVDLSDDLKNGYDSESTMIDEYPAFTQNRKDEKLFLNPFLFPKFIDQFVELPHILDVYLQAHAGWSCSPQHYPVHNQDFLTILRNTYTQHREQTQHLWNKRRKQRQQAVDYFKQWKELLNEIALCAPIADGEDVPTQRLIASDTDVLQLIENSTKLLRKLMKFIDAKCISDWKLRQPAAQAELKAAESDGYQLLQEDEAAPAGAALEEKAASASVDTTIMNNNTVSAATAGAALEEAHRFMDAMLQWTSAESANPLQQQNLHDDTKTVVGDYEEIGTTASAAAGAAWLHQFLTGDRAEALLMIDLVSLSRDQVKEIKREFKRLFELKEHQLKVQYGNEVGCFRQEWAQFRKADVCRHLLLQLKINNIHSWYKEEKQKIGLLYKSYCVSQHCVSEESKDCVNVSDTIQNAAVAILESKQPPSTIIDEPGSDINKQQPGSHNKQAQQRDKLLKQLVQQQPDHSNKFKQSEKPGKQPAQQLAQRVQLICHNAIVTHNQITLVLNPETDDISIRQLKKRAFHLLTAAPATASASFASASLVGGNGSATQSAVSVRPRLLAHFSPDASALFVLGGPRLQDFLHLSEINWSKVSALKFIIFHSTIAVK